MRRAKRQRGYQPVLEDWVWHATLPTLAYTTLLAAGIAIEWSTVRAMFYIGAAVLLLVFIGIHNAWDTVMYVMVQRERPAGTQEQRGSDASDQM